MSGLKQITIATTTATTFLGTDEELAVLRGEKAIADKAMFNSPWFSDVSLGKRNPRTSVKTTIEAA